MPGHDRRKRTEVILPLSLSLSPFLSSFLSLSLALFLSFSLSLYDECLTEVAISKERLLALLDGNLLSFFPFQRFFLIVGCLIAFFLSKPPYSLLLHADRVCQTDLMLTRSEHIL